MLLPLLLAAAAPPPPISIETLKTVTQTLSSDAFEGRKPATPAEEKTVRYIADQFARAGLQPGNVGSWYQDVPLVEITANPVMKLDVTGGKTPLSLAYRTDLVAWTKRSVPHVAVAASDMVFVGYGVVAPERGWNDYAGLDVRGKTVVILVNDPDWQAKTLDGPFGGRAMTYYGRWTYKFEEAARQGAAAALIIHQTEPAAYPFSVVQTSNIGPKQDLDAANNHMDRAAVEGWITIDAARRLFAAAGKDLDGAMAAAAQKGFRAMPLGLKGSIAIDNSIRRQMSRNVVGVLPGKGAAGEHLLFSAHWDHLGHCQPDRTGDDICNGALDNATGVAGLVALAQAYKAAPPTRRGIVFLAVTGEESNLLGSAWYAQHPIYPLATTVGAINMDGLNIAGPARDVILTGLGKSELETVFAAAAKSLGRAVTPDSQPEKGFYYRSDHFSFAKEGLPALDPGAGDDLMDGGVARGKALKDAYTTLHYHQPSDEYDPKWDWRGAQADLQLIYTTGRMLADGTSWPNWYPSDEFRAARDRMRAGK